MKYKNFESFLNEDCCPDEFQTNNSPEGFEKWMEQLDVQEVMDYAQKWGDKCFYPENDTKYFFIEESYGKLHLSTADWAGDKLDKGRFEANNFFLDEKEANTKLGKILNILN